jgi:putative holliday junction resolvase
LGQKKTGVAYGSLFLEEAKALGVIEHKRGWPPQSSEPSKLLEAFMPFKEYIQAWSPTALVVGVPYHPDGQSHKNTRFAQKVARQMRAHFGLTVLEIDERYSTTQAWSEGATAHTVDAHSACVILNQFFSECSETSKRYEPEALRSSSEESLCTPSADPTDSGSNQAPNQESNPLKPQPSHSATLQTDSPKPLFLACPHPHPPPTPIMGPKLHEGEEFCPPHKES